MAKHCMMLGQVDPLSHTVATFGEEKISTGWLPSNNVTHFLKVPITTSCRREIRLGRKQLGAKECEFPADRAIIPRATTRAQSRGSSGFLKATCTPEPVRELDSHVPCGALAFTPLQTKDKTCWTSLCSVPPGIPRSHGSRE